MSWFGSRTPSFTLPSPTFANFSSGPLSPSKQTPPSVDKSLKNFKDATSTSHFHTYCLRLNQQDHLVLALIQYYQGLRDHWVQASQDVIKLSTLLPIPFRESNQFLPNSHHAGWQYALLQVRSKLKVIADLLAESAAQVESSVLTPLHSLQSSVKTYLEAMDVDLGALTKQVDGERELTAAALGEHDKAIQAIQAAAAHQSNGQSPPPLDPFVTGAMASTQLQRQNDLETKLCRCVLHYQSLSKDFEIKLTTAIQAASRTFMEIQLSSEVRLKGEWAEVEEALSNVSANAEWEFFTQDPSRAIDPATPTLESKPVTFPQQDHPLVSSVLSGELSRQKNVTRSWAPFHWVLTPAGFLHQYNLGELDNITKPEDHQPALSIYLTEFILGPASVENDPKGQRFSLTGPRGSATGKDSSQGIGGSLGFNKSANVVYVFKANTRSEMLDWHEALTKYVQSTTTSEPASSRPNSVRSVSSSSTPHTPLDPVPTIAEEKDNMTPMLPDKELPIPHDMNNTTALSSPSTQRDSVATMLDHESVHDHDDGLKLASSPSSPEMDARRRSDAPHDFKLEEVEEDDMVQSAHYKLDEATPIVKQGDDSDRESIKEAASDREVQDDLDHSKKQHDIDDKEDDDDNDAASIHSAQSAKSMKSTSSHESAASSARSHRNSEHHAGMDDAQEGEKKEQHHD